MTGFCLYLGRGLRCLEIKCDDLITCEGVGFVMTKNVICVRARVFWSRVRTEERKKRGRG